MRGKRIFITGLKYGLAAVLLLVVSFAAAWFIVENHVLTFRQLSIVVALVFMFFAVKEYRAKHDRKLLFWQGSFVSLFTFLVFAIFSALALMIFLNHVDHDALSFYLNYKLESLDQYREHIGEEKFRDYYQQTQSQSAASIAMDHLFSMAYIGIFGSLIIAAILRKTPASRQLN